MCILQVESVRLAEEFLVVTVRATGADCENISVTLKYLLPNQAERASTQTFDGAVPETWQVAFPATPELRRILCWNGQPDFPGSWSLVLDCPNCAAPVVYSRTLVCCPALELTSHSVEPECADQASTGQLQRVLSARWRVTRNDAAGELLSQATLQFSGQQLHSAIRSLPVDQAQADFSETFQVPTGQEIVLTAELLGHADCLQQLQSRTIAPLSACGCEGQPHSTADFSVVDDNGKDVSEQIKNGECVNAKSVTVRAPSDARSGRFSWVAPTVADANDPFSTTVAVPNTDSGVTITAIIGSAPCSHERSVVIKRCISRPGFCNNLPFSCEPIKVMWAVVFYLASFVAYIGFGLLSAGITGVYADAATTLAASSNTGTGSSAIVSAGYSAAGVIASSIGLGILLAAAIGYLVWLVLSIWWFTCCGERSACQYLRSWSWLLDWIIFSLAFWALALVCLGLLFQLRYYSIAGVGFSTVFGLLFTSVFSLIANLSLKWEGCGKPNMFDRPPFLEN